MESGEWVDQCEVGVRLGDYNSKFFKLKKVEGP